MSALEIVLYIIIGLIALAIITTSIIKNIKARKQKKLEKDNETGTDAKNM